MEQKEKGGGAPAGALKRMLWVATRPPDAAAAAKLRALGYEACETHWGAGLARDAKCGLRTLAHAEMYVAEVRDKARATGADAVAGAWPPPVYAAVIRGRGAGAAVYALWIDPDSYTCIDVIGLGLSWPGGS